MSTASTAVFSTETGYNKVAATLSGHADIEYWIIYAVSEEFNVGACRAIEAADKTDDCLVVSTGCDAVFLEWDENTSPEWVATIPIYGQDIGVICAAGIVALMDGRATFETLWQEMKEPGDIATRYNLSLEVVTKDSYQDFIARSQAVIDAFN